jgi:hypothetical protein
MRFVSGILRLLCGTAIVVVAAFVYLVNQDAIIGDHPGQIALFGTPIEADPRSILIGIAAAAVIGLLLALFGVWTIVHKPAPTAIPPRSPSDPSDGPPSAAR